MNVIENKDQKLWRLAKKRAGFKRHLFTYFVINIMFWCIWLFSAKHHHGIPWPAWVTVGWGVGILFNYFEAYHGTNADLTEREYEKLKKKQEEGKL